MKLSQLGAEQYNPIPRFRPGNSESILIQLLIGWLSTQAGRPQTFSAAPQPEAPYAE